MANMSHIVACQGFTVANLAQVALRRWAYSAFMAGVLSTHAKQRLDELITRGLQSSTDGVNTIFLEQSRFSRESTSSGL
eukprot:4062150-Pyramimonas_sp.AAC.1